MSDNKCGSLTVVHVYDGNPTSVEGTVDQDINAFEQYFQGLGNDSLMGPERAIIKTYLHYKLFGPKPDAVDKA